MVVFSEVLKLSVTLQKIFIVLKIAVEDVKPQRFQILDIFGKEVMGGVQKCHGIVSPH